MNRLEPTPNKQLQRELQSTISNYKTQKIQQFFANLRMQLPECAYETRIDSNAILIFRKGNQLYILFDSF